jgi:hypothetical protein
MDETVRAAAQTLGRAGRWDVAVALIDCWSAQVPTQDQDVSLLRADLLADRAFWTSTPLPTDLRAELGELTADAPSPSWALSWFGARARYTALLQGRLAGRGVDVEVAHQLLSDLQQLRDCAPDETAELAVRFHLGLVHENLLGDAASATRHWRAAADSHAGDTAASALRHLGGQAADTGDDTRARELWWESFRLRARDGDVPGALAQLALLATSATLTEAVAAWIEAAGLTVLKGNGLADPP